MKRWKEALKLVAAIGVALGGHYVAPNAATEGVAELIALLIAARNTAIAAPPAAPAPVSRHWSQP